MNDFVTSPNQHLVKTPETRHPVCHETAVPPSSTAAPQPPQAVPPPSRSWPHLRTVAALMLREMSTRYGRSAGGYLWALLEPLGTILLLAVGFSLLVHAPSLGNNFIFFYATGFLPFHCYQQISLVVARSITFSKPLLFYPAVNWLDALTARFVLNALTNIMVIYLLFSGMFLLSDIPVQIEIWRILQSIGLALLLGLGIGTLNCALMGLFHTWDQIWSIATRPLFLASGIFYIFEDMPRAVQEILWYNPLFHITGMARAGFFPRYEPEYVSSSYVIGLSLICLVAGLLLLRRYNRDILQNR